MIKFKALIHKETGTVINYKDWHESTRDYLRIGEMKFNPSDVLFSDEFEIIYDSELTTLELILLYPNSGDLKNKLKMIVEQRHNLKRKYRIEV